MTIIPVEGTVDHRGRRPDGSPFSIKREVFAYDDERGSFLDLDMRWVDAGSFEPRPKIIPAHPGWYVHVRWSSDKPWERRLPVVAWQAPDPTGEWGAPPLIAWHDGEEGAEVVAADPKGLGANATILGLYHPALEPESQ